ncbi:hypothetical protein [Deinococcus sp.]|uniref:hypothetical protein n=1 Tax=Deinococcus sp. TaxID=47478 RepID=UPI003C7EC7CD
MKIDLLSASTSVQAARYALGVVGETPYAEGKGDTGDLSLNSADGQTVDTVCKAVKCVVVVSGRPCCWAGHVARAHFPSPGRATIPSSRWAVRETPARRCWGTGSA